MSNKRLIRTFENSKLSVFQREVIEQRRADNVPGCEFDITRADAREIVMLAERFKGVVNSAKWARLSGDDRYLLLGQYVGSISTTNLNVIISPKVDEDKKNGGKRNPYGCVDLSVLVKSAKTRTLPSEEFAVPGVIDEELFFLHAERFLSEMTREVQHGLRCGYVATSEDLKSLRGTLDTNQIALKTAIRPEVIPCKFEEFEENTLHNQVLRRAVVIIRLMLASFKPDSVQGARAVPLIFSCDALMDLLVRVADIDLTWDMISAVQLSRLESRYEEIFHYAKLLIKCVAPTDQSLVGEGYAPTHQASFSQVWDPAVLYELHIANYLSDRLNQGQAPKREAPGKKKRAVRFSVLAQNQTRTLIKSLSSTDEDESGSILIRPDIIIWDAVKGRAHLIIDTKWKRNRGVMSDVSADDAYQVHAYATTFSIKPAKGVGESARGRTYYPPVCLLYPSIGESKLPLQGVFSGVGSDFLLARSPMDEKNFQFDPAIVFGEWWPLRSR